MTKDEAIKIIEDACWWFHKKGCSGLTQAEIFEARDMAISALEQLEKAEELAKNLKKSTADYAQEYAKGLLKQQPITTSTDEPMTMVYPTIFCDDAISREAAITIASLHTLTVDESVEAIKRLPSVQPKPIECKDAISREAAYKIAMLPDTPFGKHKGIQIKELPSVQPSRKGHWIEHEKVYECSECQIIRAKGMTGKYNYCPNCGADMRGDTDGRTEN